MQKIKNCYFEVPDEFMEEFLNKPYYHIISLKEID